jgi:hypothetical protein
LEKNWLKFTKSLGRRRKPTLTGEVRNWGVGFDPAEATERILLDRGLR